MTTESKNEMGELQFRDWVYNQTQPSQKTLGGEEISNGDLTIPPTYKMYESWKWKP